MGGGHTWVLLEKKRRRGKERGEGHLPPPQSDENNFLSFVIPYHDEGLSSRNLVFIFLLSIVLAAKGGRAVGAKTHGRNGVYCP